MNRMSDLISRQAAIDVTWEEPTYTDTLNVLTEVRDKIRALPSAQPDAVTASLEELINDYGEDGFFSLMESIIGHMNCLANSKPTLL